MKFLFQPLKPFIIWQGFGESLLCYNKDTKQFVTKTNGVCPVGFISYYESVGLKGHNGLDLGAARWQPIYASTDGIVSEIYTEPERGLGIDIVTKEKYKFMADCQEWHYAKYRNWHLIAINVAKGQFVQTGDLLGWADSTGYSTGDHDHYELKPVNLAAGEYKNAHQDNGFYGAINPIPYMYPSYALEAKSIMARIKEQLAVIAEQVADLLRQRSQY